MRPRVDPDKIAAERDEIRRLELAARRACINYKRAAGNPVGADEYRRAMEASPDWKRWDEARERLGQLATADLPDVIAARRAYQYGRRRHVFDEQASAAWEGYRP